MWIYYLISVLVASNLYLRISSSKPTGLIALDDYFIQVRQKGKFWELLQVVSVPFLFLYNQFITVLFMLQGLFQILAWLFQQLIVDGLFLIIRLLFHYLVWWPWNLLLIAFAQLRNSWSWNAYKIGAIGLATTLATAFIGHFLKAQFGLPGYLGYLFSALSVLPFAYSLAKIAHWRHNHEGKSGNSNSKTWQFVLYFIGLMLLLTSVSAALLYLGTFTPLSPVMTSLFSAGSIFLSLLLIINAILVFYLLSVIPQHLLHSDSDNRTMVREVLQHLLHRWPQYIIGGALSLIPAALLSILPALLLSGSVYITKFGIEGIFDHRIDEQKAALAKSPAALPIAAMVDPQILTLDSAKSLLSSYAERKQSEIKVDNLSTTRAFVAEELGRLGHPYALLPLAGVAAEAYVFYSSEQKAIDVTPAKSGAKAAAEEDDFEKLMLSDEEKISNLDTNLRTALEQGKLQVDQLQESLGRVCAEYVATNPPLSNTITPPPPPTVNTPSMDYCEAERTRIREKITEQEEANRLLQEKLNRLNVLKEQFLLVQSDLKASKDNGRWLFALSYLLLGILIAFLIGGMASFFLVVWGNTNYAIYHQKDISNTWYITEEFAKANARSRHQPYLGILAGLVILSTVIFGSASVVKLKALLPNISLEFTKEKSVKPQEAATTISIEKVVESTPEITEVVSMDSTAFMDTTSIDAALMAIEMERLAAEADGSEYASEAEPALPAGNYLIFIDSFTTREDANQALSQYQSAGYTGLRIIVPGSFLGENSEYFLLSAGFDINETEAARIKAILDARGTSYIIQKL